MKLEPFVHLAVFPMFVVIFVHFEANLCDEANRGFVGLSVVF